MRCFEVGDVLYHKTNKTRCVIKDVLNSDIIVVLEKTISGKDELRLPKTHIGEWLFYSKDHIDLSVKHLADLNEYSHSKRISDYKEEQKRENKLQIESIKKVLESRSIINLIHFTRVENLESILTKGFIPRDILEKNNVKYYKNDLYRSDGKTNCTCFSVEFPNFFLFRRFRQKEPNSKWAIIELNADLLIKHEGEKYFCYQNAARGDIKLLLSNNLLKGGEDFENMFGEEDRYDRVSGSGVKLRNTIKGIKDYLPTSPQAEILVSGLISSKYIKKIYFNNVDGYRYFINNLVSSDISNFKFCIDSNYFLTREEATFSER